MPSVNIYTTRYERLGPLRRALPGLRELVAKELSCLERTLRTDEISLRVLMPVASLLIADTELEIIAYNYPERVQREDSICRSLKDYVQQQCPEAGSVSVWLQLLELGHSG